MLAPSHADFEQTCRQLEAIIRRDPGGRGIGQVPHAGELDRAARWLEVAPSVTIATGFYIASARCGETDGPPGAIALANACQHLGKSVALWTDAIHAPLLPGDHPILVWPETPPDGTLLLAIERCGRSRDGLYRSMRGIDITPATAPLDEWFIAAAATDLATGRQPTIGIGDGGNEIGMGRLAADIARHVPLGERIGSVVPTDALILAGVSNWGGWALVAGLTLLTGERLLPNEAEALQQLEVCVQAGAVDGVTGQQQLSVDGLPWAEHSTVLRLLAAVIDKPSTL